MKEKIWNNKIVKLLTFRAGSWLISLLVDLFLIGVPTTVIWALVNGTF